ncbi:hypothetical protein CDAR_614791 [Caerostris darwini]|uniref:Uncharacterized protein n=1 Tax=Caerostris darwini TaxID=1538125 RepID=A0AAV4U4L3_9ARAC|nr:hypothetical protein CDAR_614791 [Caerostris darwini]
MKFEAPFQNRCLNKLHHSPSIETGSMLHVSLWKDTHIQPSESFQTGGNHISEWRIANHSLQGYNSMEAVSSMQHYCNSLFYPHRKELHSSTSHNKRNNDVTEYPFIAYKRSD